MSQNTAAPATEPRLTAPAIPERDERPRFPKAATGIIGLDEITGGGLPKGRPTLICGPTGCGKTVLAMEFLVRGATEFDEPGVFMTFEETTSELTQNVASFGFKLTDLVNQKKLLLDFVYLERSEVEATGEYDLEGLFIRLGQAIDEIGAKRVVLDTIESLFAGLPNQLVLRAELRRLFRWLKDKGVTAIITGERGEGLLTRQGLEEYVSDCVIVLDHRVSEQTSSRRLRVVKYRGSIHGTNEYPFLINEDGITVMPITSLGLQHPVSNTHISTGVLRLDNMLTGKGYYSGSSVLVSGTAGTGKTSLAAHFVDAACQRGERALYFAFEESPTQIIRNMRSIGIDLEVWVTQGLLQFHASRPTVSGLEMHLTTMIKALNEFNPQVVVADPLSSFVMGDNATEVKAMCMRLVDVLKTRQITGLFTNLTSGGAALERTDIAIASLIDTWLILRDVELGGERNRCLNILKSRGMEHSNQIREFLLTGQGVELRDVYVGASGVLTGSARLAQEAQEKAGALLSAQTIERQQLSLSRKQAALEAQVAALRAEFAAQEIESMNLIGQEQSQALQLTQERDEMGISRQSDPTSKKSGRMI
jgi:circadian clock protein KaiC